MAQGFRARMNNFHSVLIEVLNTAHVMTVTVEKYFEAVSYHHSFVNLAKVMVIRCDKQVWYFAKFVFFFRFPIFQNFVKSEFSIQILQIRFPISCANFSFLTNLSFTVTVRVWCFSCCAGTTEILHPELRKGHRHRCNRCGKHRHELFKSVEVEEPSLATSCLHSNRVLHNIFGTIFSMYWLFV